MTETVEKTIVVPSVTVVGIEAEIVADNVANPGEELGNRALALIMSPYKQQTLQRAQQAYRAAYAANPADTTLPNMLNDDAVIVWYFARPDYKDATVREAEQKAIQANQEIASLTAERDRYAHKLTTASAELKPSIQDTIDSLNAQIAVLSA